MLDAIIAFALRNRLLIVGGAIGVLVWGAIAAVELPIDVLPNLTRPRVTVITEAEGLAPEEVERGVTVPIESAVNGASGVLAVRSASDIGLSVIDIDFQWGTDPNHARQVVQERLTTVQGQLPDGLKPRMGPRASLLGQIAIVAMWSNDGDVDPMRLRTEADWVVKRRLAALPGVAQVIVMGGKRKQFHVLVDRHELHHHDLELADVETALRESNRNVSGGFMSRDERDFLIRGIARCSCAEDIEKIVVRKSAANPIVIGQVAEVREAGQSQRGDASVNGRPAVVLTIQKQPSEDTRAVTARIHEAIEEIRPSLPRGVTIEVTYEQREFIERGVSNVIEALRDGAVLVIVVLFVFLLNFRTTLITLIAIPISILITALVFRCLGLSINVMTLGGIAVGLGELVDDSIVDVENIFRRLRENRAAERPRPVLRVVYDASVEVRNAILISTVLVVVVFAPLFALSGMAGRLFTPLGVAYIVSIIASTLVSLTVTPVLSSWLLGSDAPHRAERDGWLLRHLKSWVQPVIRFSLTRWGLTTSLTMLGCGCVASGLLLTRMPRDFLPPFNEGAAQVNLFAPSGVSLETSRELSRIADARLLKLTRSEARPDAPIQWFTCRTGRAEMDEHVMGVNVSEYVISLNQRRPLARRELASLLQDAVAATPAVETEVEQPIAHLISHLLSGVNAEIAIKIIGDDLAQLRRVASDIKSALADTPGVREPIVEQQDLTPQFRVELKHDMLAHYGVTAEFVNDFVETALQGRRVSLLYEGQRTFDILLRLRESQRRDLAGLRNLPLELPNGLRVPLKALASVYEAAGPNVIRREDGRRRIVVRVNTNDGDLGAALDAVRNRIQQRVRLPEGCYVTYGGQFEARRQANQRILWLSIVAVLVVAVVLYSAYQSVSIVLQLLTALPAAFIGGVVALFLTGQSMSIAATVGFISLGGIAARNGLLLVSTYLQRVRERGFESEAIVQGSLDRLAPVLMTALTTGLGLAPLMFGSSLPGKSILAPVATVVLGGLLTSTVAEFLIRPGLFWYFPPNRRAIDAAGGPAQT